MKYILVYLASVNIFAVFICWLDKCRAQKGGWRISEKMLFGASLAGGAVGMYFTMLKIRHKTRHKRFMIGLPIIIVLQLALCYIFVDSGVYII